jgi:signal transduction histidine kinase
MQVERKPLQSRQESAEERERLSEGRTMAAIAHELRNPIQTLGNLLYLATQEASTQAGRDYLTLAQQQVKVLRTIVVNTLGAMREQSVEANVNVSELLDGSLRNYAEKISYKRITVDKRVEFTDKVTTSPVEVRMIIDNILSNALEAVPIGGRVFIHLCKARNWIGGHGSGYRIVICDNGPGIHPEHRKRIFEPFFTTKTEKGTGIGLWVVQRTVQKHGGAIHFRSRLQPGKTGSVFSVFLPIAEKRGRSAQLNAESATQGIN